MSQLARVYRVEVISAALVAGASALLGSLVLMGLISPALGDPPAVLMVAIAICAVFFVLNLALIFAISSRSALKLSAQNKVALRKNPQDKFDRILLLLLC